ncbi:MAG: hypothetical protein PVJ92_01710 [Candidatus Dependentiae bacterium]|jgi:hypothetical protein
MATIWSLWQRSAAFIFSLSNLMLLLGRMRHVLLTAVITLIVLLGSAQYSLTATTKIGTIVRWFFSLPIPLPAMLLSAFYLPSLIQAQERDGRHHQWWYYFISSALFYGTASGVAYLIWLFYAGGSPVMRTALIGVGIAFAPLIAFFGTISPFLVLAMSYDPTVGKPFKQIFRHSVYMTGAELPALALVFLLLMPLTGVVYFLPVWLAQNGIIAAVLRVPMMHVCSVLYWQIGWTLFIALYQERKAVYVKSVVGGGATT